MLNITLINTITVTKEDKMLDEIQYYRLQTINLQCLLS